MNISHNLSQQLTQKLTLSKEMLQALELIQLPLIDLRERIEKELLENPALELNEERMDKKSEEQNIDNIENSFTEEANYFEDSSSADINTGVSPSSSGMDLKRQFLEGAITHKENLYDHLIWQLNMSDLSEEKKRIGETIISLIDENGFFKDNIEEIFPQEPNLAKDVLETIQTFDPAGIATPNVKEALIFQLESLQKENLNKNAYNIVIHYFDLMVARKDHIIAKNLRITNEDVREAFDFLSQFDPYPGRKYSSEEPRYVIPDAFVYKMDNELVVEINNDILPFLTIASYMRKIAKDVKRKKALDEQRKYVVEKVNSAKKFIKTLRHRKESLFRLVLSIVKNQEDFFRKGPKHIKPLTMKIVAEEIGLSESTISRLSSSKYVQTEWGLHEIKYFFSNSLGKSGVGGDTSSESVREMIKEILLNEKTGKITDQKISEILSNKGIKIARRTVSKYRKILNILPSHQRGI